MSDLRTHITAMTKPNPPTDTPLIMSKKKPPVTAPFIEPEIEPEPEPEAQFFTKGDGDGDVSSLVNSVFKSANPDHRVVFQMVELKKLTIDPEIQRPENKALIYAIGRDFDINAFGVATGSVRVSDDGDETIVTVDGQQRSRGAIRAGWEGLVPMQLHYGLSRAEEAALFRRLNFKRSVSAIHLFRAAVIEGDPKVLAIVEALDDLQIPFSPSKGFTAVAVAKRLAARKGGIYNFRRALVTIRAIYDTDGKGGVYDGRVVEAFARFFERYDKRINEQELREKLMKMPGGLAGLIGHAATVKQSNNARPMLFNLIDAIVLRYNHGKHRDGRNMLPLWKEEEAATK